MIDTTCTLADGRTVAYTDLGDPGGRPVVFFHGAPSSRLALVRLDDELATAGVRVVSPDRPGFGGSSPQPGRTLPGYGRDVVALADHLGLSRFTVAGHSSGGPYAVAAAALLPDHVTASLVVAGVTDMGWPDAWDGYVTVEADLMRQPDEQSAVAAAERRFGADGSRFFDVADFDMSDPDAAVLADPDEGAAEMNDAIEAFRQGVAGYAQDVWLEGHPWPFDPATIGVPVHVVHGREDRLVPAAHNRHTAGLIPGATLEVLDGEGHLSIVRRFPSLFAALA